MKKLMLALAGLFPLRRKAAAPVSHAPVFKTQRTFSVTNPTSVDTTVVSSGPGYAFADVDGLRAYISRARACLTGGTWLDVRPGRRVRLGVVQNRSGEGLVALSLEFIDATAAA